MNWYKQYHEIQSDLQDRIALEAGMKKLKSELNNDMFKDYHVKALQKLQKYKHSNDSETMEIVNKIKSQMDTWLNSEQAKVQNREDMLQELTTQFQDQFPLPSSADASVDGEQPECMREAQNIWKGCTDMFSTLESYHKEYDAYVTKLGIVDSVGIPDATIYTFSKDTFDAAGGNEVFTELSRFITPNYKNIEKKTRTN